MDEVVYVCVMCEGGVLLMWLMTRRGDAATTSTTTAFARDEGDGEVMMLIVMD